MPEVHRKHFLLMLTRQHPSAALKWLFFFHDESTFSANEDQNIVGGGGGGQKTIKPKSKGAVIMVSDFIDEHQGFLARTDEGYKTAKASNPGIKKYARAFLKYGESREGYWTRDKFVAQVDMALKIAEYPKSAGW